MSDYQLVDQLHANDLLSKPYNEVQRLAKKYNRYHNKTQQPKQALKIALLCGFTVDFLADLLPLMFLRLGFEVDIYKGGYSEIASELLVLNSYHKCITSTS